MEREPGAATSPHFQHDIGRLNQLAEQVGLFASVWLGMAMRNSYLPDYAKEAYIGTLAHNYRRGAPLVPSRQLQKLALRLEQQYSSTDHPFSVSRWVATTMHLNRLPALPSIAAERRFMRYLALRDLQEFIGAFGASPQQRHQLRPWVTAALNAAMRQNQLELAWNNSITLWDNQTPPRPRTIVRAHLQPGLWHAHGRGTASLH